jgi:hypothetical protein
MKQNTLFRPERSETKSKSIEAIPFRLRRKDRASAQRGIRFENQVLCLFLILFLAILACTGQAPATPFPTPETSIFDAVYTTYGFFPSPPEASTESILNH